MAPDAIDFGEIDAGDTDGHEVVVRLTNLGSSPGELSSVRIEGEQGSWVSASAEVPRYIAQGEIVEVPLVLRVPADAPEGAVELSLVLEADGVGMPGSACAADMPAGEGGRGGGAAVAQRGVAL